MASCWRNGRRFEIKLTTFVDRPELPLIATAVQEELRQVGIAVKVVVGNSSDIPAGHRSGALQIGLVARNFGSLPDPVATLADDYGVEGGDWGAMGWHSAPLSEALARLSNGGVLAGSAQAARLRAEVARELQQGLPVIPARLVPPDHGRLAPRGGRQHRPVRAQLPYFSIDLEGRMKTIFKALIQALLVALLVGTLCFFMTRMLPGDTAYRIAAGRYGYDMVDAAAAQAVRIELGLDRAPLAALADWWGRLLRFDLGVSLVTAQPVIDEIRMQLGQTLRLSLMAVLLSLPLGPLPGVLAGLRPGGWFDRVNLALSVLLRAMPPFVLALLLVLAVCRATAGAAGRRPRRPWQPAAARIDPGAGPGGRVVAGGARRHEGRARLRPIMRSHSAKACAPATPCCAMARAMSPRRWWPIRPCSWCTWSKAWCWWKPSLPGPASATRWCTPSLRAT